VSKIEDNEAFVREVQAVLGVGVDGHAGPRTVSAWRAKEGVAGSSSETPDSELIAALKQDEGLRLKAYPDPLSPRAKTGKGSGDPWSIGYGRAHGIKEGDVITEAVAEKWLIEDAQSHNKVIHRALPWLKDLDPVRRRVIENMHFNMGWDNPKTPAFEGLSGFKNTLEAVRTGRYAQAAAGMLASLWAKQVKGRAVRLAHEMQTGRVG